MKFKDGDEVRIKRVVDNVTGAGPIGYYQKKLEALKHKDLAYPLIVQKFHGDREFTYHLKQPNGLYGFANDADWCDEELEFYNKQNMNIKEKFLISLKSEPHKSFRKAGITNGDDMLTDEGREIFLGYLLSKYGDDFKKDVVDELLKKEDKEE